MDLVLENAAWPALLVDQHRVIRATNPAAVRVCGPMGSDGNPQLDTLWAPENETSLDRFWQQLDPAIPAVHWLKFRVQTGAVARFRVCIGSLTQEGGWHYLFQLFREDPSVPAQPARTTSGPTSPGIPEAPLLQKQKLDCAMQLIRTVALDFNNALTSILGHTSLLLSQANLQGPWRGSLVEIEKSAEKAAEIASDLAAFSRQDKDARALTAGNLNEMLRRAVALFQDHQAPRIQWTIQLESRLYSVQFDEAKVEQAFIKILENAVQAIDQRGAIGVCSRNLDRETPTNEVNLNLAPGRYVCVEVVDNGRGIPKDVLPRIFEPFFTTKPNHRGLGLAWVYGVVTNHGGSVAVASQAGQGTSVRVCLPAQKRLVKDTAVKADELSGHETVLLVDDDDLLLTMGRTVLSAFGYQVLTADSGRKALEIIALPESRIDLVITDMVMPRMGGRELIERLRQLRPDLRIICASGYVRPRSHEEAETYLLKPFTSQDLLRKVKQALT